ncbi:MAG: O-antigen ligase family protein [Rickettsiales bacterium]
MFTRKFRILVLIFAVFLVSILTIIGMSINIGEVGLEATGKDATLTGRTELWERGIESGMENPLLGVGLGAFWMHGNPVAEKIWYDFAIPSRSGFHFHNFFINVFVEIGLIGVALWVLMFLYVCVKSFRDLLKDGDKLESIFYVGISFMYLLRSIVESDAGGPYGTGPLLFFYIVFRVASRNIGKNMQKPALSFSTKPLGL